MNTQIIILAGGKGTRMGIEEPKVLLQLAGQSLIRRLLGNIKSLISKFLPIVVVGYQQELVRSTIGDGCLYAVQEQQMGTAHAVSCALSQVGAENVLVLYGDMPFITAATLENLIKLHEQNNSKFSMLTVVVPNFEKGAFMDFGRIIRDEQRNPVAIRELVDASAEEKDIKELNTGIYLFNSQWLKDHIDLVKKNKHGEYYLTDLLEIATKQKLAITTAQVDPKEVFGINTPEQLRQAESFLDS